MSRSESTPRAKPKCAVLVVEDDPDIQRLLEVVLARHCRSVDVAGDGEQAIAMLKSGDYGLAVLDVMLPKVNGIEVAELARTLPSPPKLIVLSAISRYVQDRFPPEAVILQKPFDLDRIEGALRDLEIID